MLVSCKSETAHQVEITAKPTCDSKKSTDYFYFMCMGPWCPWKPDEETGATDSCEPTL